MSQHVSDTLSNQPSLRVSVLRVYACSERGFLAKLLEAADAEGLTEIDVIAQVSVTLRACVYVCFRRPSGVRNLARP